MHTAKELNSYAELAQKLAVKGGTQAIKAFRSHHFSETQKSDHSFATSADTQIEAQLRQQIRSAFPSHSIWGEEAGSEGQADGLAWNIDPIDGTHNFMFGVPVFGTMISLTHGTDVLVMAAYDPNTKQLFSATKGAGATANGSPVSVSTMPQTSLKQQVLLVEWGKNQPAQITAKNYLFTQSEHFRSYRKYGCILPAFACTASNHFGALIYFGMEAREISGPALFMSEAGLHVTDLRGAAWNLQNGSTMVAAHPVHHGELLKTLEASQL